MTTAAKPTFFPAVGGEDQGYFRMEGGTRQVSVKDLPGHTKLKLRKQGQASRNEVQQRDLVQELQDRERKAAGRSAAIPSRDSSVIGNGDSAIAQIAGVADKDADDIVANEVAVSESSDDDDDEDETAELMRELARIKQEREQEAARKAVEDKAREEAEKKEALLRGNPLLASSSFAVKRRWDDDHVFRNQARGEGSGKKRFINDTIRNDFHRKFLNKYVK
mmetsp:Transcript_51070/g.106667  ORF Transcript_51070/g.106667 Transcript_51070/m.106667 type:complete len:221 (-) Transcript_51070:195-857(-)